MTRSRAARGLGGTTATLLLAHALPLLVFTLWAPPARADPDPAEIYDPIERVNRGVFAFNDWLDRWILARPMARDDFSDYILHFAVFRQCSFLRGTQ